MSIFYLLIIFYLSFPMIIYYFIDVIKAYLDKGPLPKWTNAKEKN